jgi:hypothetical protein
LRNGLLWAGFVTTERRPDIWVNDRSKRIRHALQQTARETAPMRISFTHIPDLELEQDCHSHIHTGLNKVIEASAKTGLESAGAVTGIKIHGLTFVVRRRWQAA